MITCEQERIFSISGKYTQGYSVLKAKTGTIEALQIVSFAQANFCLTFVTGAQKGRKAEITCENWRSLPQALAPTSARLI